ncbi:putative DNA-binding phage protein [Yersinia pseudotuberculosis]|uniref:hypothetical protein n=1 Tax=Yersinia pseudotuberculosis TaxID=633 RepID=UPI0005DD518E|nr:hypothetical protein [Yersinia pseudotuberculosis]CNK60675.1 putative DNA-binding phage protein [Yersinia pseudotuberculosis]
MSNTAENLIQFPAQVQRRGSHMENQKQGHVAIFRSALFADWARDPIKLATWVQLIGRASHKARIQQFADREWPLERGQLVTTAKVFSLLLLDKKGEPLPVKEVQRLWLFFENEGMISKRGTPFGTVFTIINYDSYQSGKSVQGSVQPFVQPKASPLLVSEGVVVQGPVQPFVQHNKNVLNNLKDIPPIVPQGEEVEEILNQAKQALEYYNEISKSTCRDAKPYLTLLTATTSRSAYTLQDLNLVTRWALTVWKRRGNSCPKPKSLCAVTRFDGYLSDAEKWLQSSVDIDCQAVIDAYNEVTAGKLPEADLDRDREIAIRELAQHLAKKNVEGFRAYFAGFIEDARDFYFGGPDGIGWKASFEYLMKPETLRKVRRGEL